ncbi:hypothetical protein [Pseudogulbenkiania sp. MAI-1]|uniref:hypothetical protein n=1 Tax=Pseudogulbenkiania sp. MAI-1 TaxID=990370 RepID=UPI00045E9C60|nr:hypothetical protein [Pseudogulbenkiania sp. MAI-1]
MTFRDPKKHPQPGDVLRRFGSTRYVTDVASKASGTLISVYFNAGTPDSQKSNVNIGTWRSWANADCEVLLRDDTNGDTSAPHMYIATHRCGGLVASSWDDPGYEAENRQNCRDWLSRGYAVAKIIVREATPPLPWCECIRREEATEKTTA